MSGKDLGTYYVRVEFMDGRGFLAQWNTGQCFCKGNGYTHPLDAYRIAPPWKDEATLFRAIEFIYTDGNFSCDCNKALFLARAAQEEEPEETKCGDTMPLRRLTAIRPDGSEVVIWEIKES